MTSALGKLVVDMHCTKLRTLKRSPQVTSLGGQTNSYFVYSNIPWFIRGGGSDLEQRAGLLYSLHDNGHASSYYGFRAALVME